MSHKLIILVEDDLNLRQSIALILQRAGYFVTATDCAIKAMNIIQSGSYQLIIADVNMPDTRKKLLPKVLSMYPNLSIVILTDQSSSEIDKEDKLTSAHYLIKPIAPERLLDCVGTIVGKRINADQ
jgi:two-component system, NtrC family, response regulator HydG